MRYFWHIVEQLLISVLGGIISGLVVTWILKIELKKILPRDSLKRIFSKEIIIICLLVGALATYVVLVKKGLVPSPELHDYMVVYDENGNQFLLDGCHPQREKIPTGIKEPLEPAQWDLSVPESAGESEQKTLRLR